MSCSARLGVTSLALGILLSVLGNALLPRMVGSRLILLGFLLLLLPLLGWIFPRIFFWKENSSQRRSSKIFDHPERLPLVSTFPNGDFLIGVQDKRYRMWRTEEGTIVCQQIEISTGHLTGPRLTSAYQVAAIGIPGEVYKRLEQALKMESKFL